MRALPVTVNMVPVDAVASALAALASRDHSAVVRAPVSTPRVNPQVQTNCGGRP